MPERPYSRIYHSVEDDPKFLTVYDNDRMLATWVRLLIEADKAHPSTAHIPEGTNRTAVRALADLGIIDLGTGSRYRIHGLDAERAARSHAARVGGLASGRSRAVGTSVEQPLNDRSPNGELNTRRVETRQDEQGDGSNGTYPDDGPRDSQDRYYELTLYRPWGIWSGEKLLAAERDYGRAETIAALEAEWTISQDRKTILDRVLARLARAADLEKQAKKSRPRPSRPDPEAAYVESQRIQAELIAGIAAVKDVP
jgi:hypothetical protein